MYKSKYLTMRLGDVPLGSSIIFNGNRYTVYRNESTGLPCIVDEHYISRFASTVEDVGVCNVAYEDVKPGEFFQCEDRVYVKGEDGLGYVTDSFHLPRSFPSIYVTLLERKE